jgi:hypothetical protein
MNSYEMLASIQGASPVPSVPTPEKGNLGRAAERDVQLARDPSPCSIQSSFSQAHRWSQLLLDWGCRDERPLVAAFNSVGATRWLSPAWSSA